MSIPTVTQPVGVFAQFALDCAAAAATVINPTYVFLGHYEWAVLQDFYKELPRAQSEIFIGSPKGAADDFNLEGDFQTIAELFYTIPADVPSSLVPLMQQVAKLNAAWAAHFQKWVSGGNRNPLRVEWDYPQIRRHEKPFILSTKFTLHSRFVPDQAALPVLVPAVPGN